jgi:serine/threonine-protein kinase
MAVDGAGTVYITNTGNNRVLKLPAGVTAPTELPFTGLNGPRGVAVDTAGTVYITDTGNNRVLKLPAG